MKILKRLALILILFTGFAANSHGETLYSVSMGYYRLSDIFLKEDFGRQQNGMTFNFTFYYYPKEEAIFGVFFRTSFGTFFSGYEWKDDLEMKPISYYAGGSDVRLSPAFSYMLRLGKKIRIPFSLGPSFAIYWEEGRDSVFEFGERENKSYFYESLKLGILADAALILTPHSRLLGNRFFIKQGISVGWDFLNGEKGNMGMNYRTVQNNRSKVVPYSAIALSLYFGIGISFD